METAPARATLVATVTTLPEGSFTPLASELEGIDWLEIRADLVGDLDAARLARLFPGKLLYTLRSKAEGGGFEGSPERRRKRLIEAAARYDLVDLEAARDLTPDVLKAVPAGKRVISWHGAAPDSPAVQFSVYSGSLEWKEAVADDEYAGRKLR